MKSSRKSNSGFVPFLKTLWTIVKLVLLVLVAIGLYATYNTLESKFEFLLVLISVHFVVFIIALLLARKVFDKNKGVIKQHFNLTWKIALLGVFLHTLNLYILLSHFQFSLSLYNQFIILSGIICSAFVVRQVSFLGFV
jgi:hypothetical protein